MTRLSDRKAARREARKRRAELRLFDAAWGYAADFDEPDHPVLATSPVDRRPTRARGDVGQRLPEEPEHEEMLAELMAAALHFAWMVPRKRRRHRPRRR